MYIWSLLAVQQFNIELQQLHLGKRDVTSSKELYLLLTMQLNVSSMQSPISSKIEIMIKNFVLKFGHYN